MSATSALRLLSVGLLFAASRSCYQCLDDVNLGLRLCWGHVLTENGIRDVGACFKKLNRIFNNNERVIEAGRVGRGHDKQMKQYLEEEIKPMADEFDNKKNNETVYEERLQTAADNFIAAASKLPRATGCFPPCGFQSAGAVFNCITCNYDSCEFPLDCPVKEMEAKENKRSEMWCNVPFQLPGDMGVVWRFAEEVKTQQVDQFSEVTAGVDRLYAIPSTSLQHQGTYQCEIYSGRRSVVRLYFYLAVTPQVVEGHTELQEIFDLSLLPGGRLVPLSPPLLPQHHLLLLLPWLLLLTACVTALLLLIFLSLGVLCRSFKTRQSSPPEQEQVDEDEASTTRGRDDPYRRWCKLSWSTSSESTTSSTSSYSSAA